MDSDKQIDMDYEEDEEDPLSPPSGDIQLNEGIEDELEDEVDDTDDTASDEEQHEVIEEDEGEKPRKSLKGVGLKLRLLPYLPRPEDFFVCPTIFLLTQLLPLGEFVIGLEERLVNSSLLMESLGILLRLMDLAAIVSWRF